MGNQLPNKVNRLAKVLVDDLDIVQVSSLLGFLTSMSGGLFVLRGRSIEVSVPLAGSSSMSIICPVMVFDTAGSFEIVRIKPETGEEGGKL
jgi:hypothetical protein